MKELPVVALSTEVVIIVSAFSAVSAALSALFAVFNPSISAFFLAARGVLQKEVVDTLFASPVIFASFTVTKASLANSILFEESFRAHFFALSIVKHKTFSAAGAFIDVIRVTFLAVSGTFLTNTSSSTDNLAFFAIIGTFNSAERESSAAALASAGIGACSTRMDARGANTAVGVETRRAGSVTVSLVQVFANSAFSTSVEVRVAVLASGVDTGGADSSDGDVTLIAVFFAVFALKVERPLALQAGISAITVSAVLMAVEAGSVGAEVSSGRAVSVTGVIKQVERVITLSTNSHISFAFSASIDLAFFLFVSSRLSSISGNSVLHTNSFSSEPSSLTAVAVIRVSAFGASFVAFMAMVVSQVVSVTAVLHAVAILEPPILVAAGASIETTFLASRAVGVSAFHTSSS
jgi:hypothetical protein